MEEEKLEEELEQQDLFNNFEEAPVVDEMKV